MFLFGLGCSLAASSCSTHVLGEGDRRVVALFAVLGLLTLTGSRALRGARVEFELPHGLQVAADAHAFVAGFPGGGNQRLLGGTLLLDLVCLVALIARAAGAGERWRLAKRLP